MSLISKSASVLANYRCALSEGKPHVDASHVINSLRLVQAVAEAWRNTKCP
jgi:hypothetical protein